MKFVWYMPKQETDADKNKEKPLGGASGPDVTPGRVKLSEIGADLKGFIESTEKVDPKDKAEFLKKAQQWNQTENIDEIRRAGVTAAENEKDPLKKHKLLSSLFLERDKKPGAKMSFKVNFQGNDLAERKVGAGDLLPVSAKAIRVQYADGRVVDRAIRAVNPATGRIGYYEANALQQGIYQYIPVFSGTNIDVLETQTSESFEVKRRMFAENMEIYNPPKRNAAPSAGPSYSGFNQGNPYKTPGASSLMPRYPSAGPRASFDFRVPGSAPTSGVRSIEGRSFEAVDRNFWNSTVGATPEAAGRFITRIDPVTKEPLSFMGAKIPDGMNALIIPYLKEAERRIKDKGINYHVHTATCTCWRNVRGSDSRSYHSWGVALDINPADNGMGTAWNNLDPAKRVPMELVEIMESLGFRWGGRWSGRPDSMHFEFGINPLTSTALLTTPEAQKYKVAILDPIKPSTAPKQYASMETPGGIANNKTKDYGKIAEDHSANFQKLEVRPEEQKKLAAFREKVLADKERYQRVAQVTGFPWMLIAAIHERESGGNFSRYLGNGDPLDRVTTHVPAGRGPFPDWESGAIDALGLFTSLKGKLGITADTTDPGLLLTFAEQYNGLGYRNRGYVSPYVYSGTNIYQGGKITTDNGPYRPEVWDKQLGVAEMLVALGGPEDYGPQKKNIAIA